MSERPINPVLPPHKPHGNGAGPDHEAPAAATAPPVEAAPVAAAPAPRRRWWLWGAIAAVVVVGGVFGARYVQNAHNFVSTNNAYIRGDILDAGFKIPGRVASLKVDVGDTVKRGELLGTLEDTEIAIQLRQAQANVAAAKANLESSRSNVTLQRQQTAGQEAQADAGVEGALRNLAAARVTATRARADFDRIAWVYREGGLSRQQYDSARASMQTAAEQAQAAEAAVRAAKASAAIAGAGQTQVQIREKAVETSQATIAQAEAALAAATQQLANTRLLAPSDGVVAKKEVVVGEMVSPGQSVVSVVDPESVYLEAMVDETHIQHVKRGEPVKVEIDAYPGRTFEGHVSEVGVATGSEFALIPQNNASGNFTKVVQRLPVKIALENPDHMLKPGMSAVVAIDVREKR